MASFTLLASLIVLSSISVMQLSSNNAYAQSGTTTVTATCEIRAVTGPGGGQIVPHLEASVSGAVIGDFYYIRMVDDSGTEVFLGGSRTFQSDYSGSGTAGAHLADKQFTVSLYHDVNNNFPNVLVEESELVDTTTVTCPPLPSTEPEPPLTERFRNQGQCVAFANQNPESGVTKEACKIAFKA